jgi:hypothetical protein
VGVVKRARSFEGMLRWYPVAWRRRYGGELAALLEDTYGRGPVPWRCRFALLRAGWAERLRAWGLLGSAAPSEGVRAGSLLVLCAWAVFMVAEAGFPDLAENWRAAVPGGSGARLAAAGYGAVYWAGAAGCVIVLLGAGICAPSVVRFLRASGWRQNRRRLLQAIASLAVIDAGVLAMVLWTHEVGPGQHAGLWVYQILALGVTGIGPEAGLVALLIGATTERRPAAATVARLDLPPRVRRYCGALAVALTTVMAALAGGTVAWWTAIASRAPWFLGRAAPGTAGTIAPPALVTMGLLMVVGLMLGIIGARRVTTFLRRTA